MVDEGVGEEGVRVVDEVVCVVVAWVWVLGRLKGAFSEHCCC